MFKDWEEVRKYQEDVVRILTNSMKLNRVSHSYIFEGPNGTKKEDTALLFAKTLFCLNQTDGNPCNSCHNCHRVDNLTHPNLFFIKPTGKVIKKEVVTDLIKEFSKASLEDGKRVYIVVDADRFNQSSANTLLKTMEEPGQEIYQVLITENYNGLLSTIISRAETLHFKPIDRTVIKDFLCQINVEETLANIISQYTADIEAAEKIAKSKEMEEIILLVKEIFANMLLKDRSSIISFYQSSNVLSNIEKIDFFLSLLILYQKDILNTKINSILDLVFINEKEVISRLARKLDIKQIKEILDEMLSLSNKLKYNINTTLAFNKLLMSMERGYKYATHSRSDTV